MYEPIIKTSQPTIKDVYNVLQQGNEIYKIYKQIIDSYVLDFFTSSHWDSLPLSWKTFFDTLSPKELSYSLSYEKFQCSKVAPLSLQCLRNLLQYLSIPRSKIQSTLIKNDNFDQIKSSDWGDTEHEKVMKLFWKSVKVKKRYELSKFAEYTYQMALKSNCKIVIDIGAGLGHLCRLLNYGYGLRVIGIEAQNQLVEQAKKLDESFEKLATKYDPNFKIKHPHTPNHLQLTIKNDMLPNDFIKFLQSTLNSSNVDLEAFGIVGLHPCGDLGPILLNLYKKCPNIRFVNIVGCCYMKLTSENSLTLHKNTSNIEESLFELSYHSREIACHAMETYIEKLRSENYWELKVHAYRATLEKVLEEKYPDLRHVALANVKYTPDTTFLEYCQKALKKLSVDISNDEVSSKEIDFCLNQWKRVVTFYTIRLMFAPLIETLIILDRYLFIFEDGCSFIETIFDPKLSPRNFVVSGLKI